MRHPFDSLAEGIAVGPEFSREGFVEHDDVRCALVLRFGGGESATAQLAEAHGGEILRAHGVPADVEAEAFGGGRGFRVACRARARATDFAAATDHAEGNE